MQLLGVDERMEPLGGPGGQPFAVVAAPPAPGSARGGTGSSRRGRGTRPPSGRRAARRPRPGSARRPRPASGRPSRPGRRRRRTCGAASRPASAGPSLPGGTRGPGRGRRPGRRRRPSRTRNSSRSLRSNSKFVAVVPGELAEVLFLEVQAVPGVGPVGQRLPGPFRRVGVGRQVLLDGLADHVGDLALGLVLGLFLGLLELRALEVAGLELDAEPLAGPLGEAGRAVVVGQEAGGGVARSGCRSCRGWRPWAARRRGAAGGTSRSASAARP